MRLGYMFSGQGSQYPGMGRDLYEASPAAKAVFDEAENILGRSMTALCFDSDEAELTSCANCQPAIFTMSQACLAAFKEQASQAVPSAVEPTVCGGLSLGELSALTAAGVFSFADGLRLVARRGELMDGACRETAGTMAAVLGADEKNVQACCGKHGIDVANVNCPGQIVVSGEKGGVAAVSEELSAAGFRVVSLTVAGAYHSRLMSGAASEFGACLERQSFAASSCGIVQNVVGGFVSDCGQMRCNLQRQVCSSVRWEECARAMMSRCDMLLEFGPGKVLCGFMKRIDRGFKNMPVNGMEGLAAAVAAVSGI